jgi:hypothetical protein
MNHSTPCKCSRDSRYNPMKAKATSDIKSLILEPLTVAFAVSSRQSFPTRVSAWRSRYPICRECYSYTHYVYRINATTGNLQLTGSSHVPPVLHMIVKRLAYALDAV